MRTVNFPRVFQIWTYQVGHGALLLHSTKTDEHPSRIDVLFVAVSFMSLPTLLDGLRVEVADAAPADTPAGTLEDRTVFRIIGTGFVGYVVASEDIRVQEDLGEFHEPGLLDQLEA